VAVTSLPAARRPVVSTANTAKEYFVEAASARAVTLCVVLPNFPTRWPEDAVEGATDPTASRITTPAKEATVGLTHDRDTVDDVTPLTDKDRTDAGRVVARTVAGFAALPAELIAKTANAYLVDGARPDAVTL
jgi:hypothetical protein